MGKMSEAGALLKDMGASGTEPSLRTINTMLRGYKKSADIKSGYSLFLKAKKEWGIDPDRTTYEAVGGLLCQGLQPDKIRELMRKTTFNKEDPLDLRAASLLWDLVAESSLLLNEPPTNSRLAFDRAVALRKKANKKSGHLWESSKSTQMFLSFKEKELEEHSSMIRSYVNQLKVGPEAKATSKSYLKYIGRLVVPPADEAPSAEGIILELQRCFGLTSLIDSLPAGVRQQELDALIARFRTLISDKKQLDLKAVFDDSSLPLKLELCSGDGEWVCTQASTDAGLANWACVELRRERVFRTASRAFFQDVQNLCVVGGDAVEILQSLAPKSVASIFVNFPEPPERRGGGIADGLVLPHFLTAETLKLIRRALVQKGTLLILSENSNYMKQLAEVVHDCGGFESVRPGNHSVCATVESVQVWNGKPGYECGVTASDISSYFDRLWKNGKFHRRYFIYLGRAGKKTHEE